MSERERIDRMDRIERKLNRIARFVLFSTAFLSILVAVVTEQYYDHFTFGYGPIIAMLFVGLMFAVLLLSYSPFRD